MTVAAALAFPGVGRVVASIPSPSNGTLEIGPLKIHAYGLMIALGVVAGVWLLGRRLEQRGIGTRDDANSIAVWAVIAGVIGSRLYHVATDWSKFSGNLGEIPKIWKGGLGIPGGLIAGIGVGAYLVRKRGIPVAQAVDCAAPAIALAQAIGRWGNYWNQELYGRTTTLPWGLEIDDAHRPLQYQQQPNLLFHPTFLYESLANLVLVGILLTLDRRRRVRPGHLTAFYLIGYGVIRFFVEGLRIDEAHHVGGLRWNQWVSIAAIVGAVVYLALSKSTLPEPAAAPLGDHDDPDAGTAEVDIVDIADTAAADDPDSDPDTDVDTETDTDTEAAGDDGVPSAHD